MKLHELYTKKFTISFEIFPPKTPKGEDNLRREMANLSKYRPGFVSVTYGAGGSTRDRTLELSLEMQKSFCITPLVHFTCVGMGRDDIGDYMSQVRANGIENILALRGDPPAGETSFVPRSDGFRYASELVAFLRSISDFTIGVAGYPEGHVEAPNLETDIENLKKKVDAGADYIITQLFYNNNDFYDFMDRIRKKGITLPVIPGIMPVTNRAQVEKVTSMCGAKIPPALAKTLESCSAGTELCERGIEHSILQCRELKSWGVPGFHFYTLNRSFAVEPIIEALGL